VRTNMADSIDLPGGRTLPLANMTSPSNVREKL
jgi:hypothetical protein